MGAYDAVCQDLRYAKGWADGAVELHVVLDGGRPELKAALADRRAAAVTGLEAIDLATTAKLGARPEPCGKDGCDCAQCAKASKWDVAYAKYVRSSEYTEGLKAHLSAVAHRKSIDLMPWAIRALRASKIPYSVAPMEAEDQIMATKSDVAVGYDADYVVKNANPKTPTVLLAKGSMAGTRVQRCIKLKHLDKPDKLALATKTAKNDSVLDKLLLTHGRDALRRVAKLDRNDYNSGLMPTGFGLKTAIKAAAASYDIQKRNDTLTECQAMATGVATVCTGTEVDVEAITEVLEMVTLLFDHHAVYDAVSGEVDLAAPYDPAAFLHHTEEEAHVVTGVSRYTGTKFAAADAVDYATFSRGALDPRTYEPWAADLLPPGGLGGQDDGDGVDELVLCYRDGSTVPEDDEPPADLDKWAAAKCKKWLKLRGFKGFSEHGVKELRDNVRGAYELGLIAIKPDDFDQVHQARYETDSEAWDSVELVRLHGTPLDIGVSEEDYRCPVCPASVVKNYFVQREADTLRNRTQGETRDVREFRYLVEKPAAGAVADGAGCKPCRVSGCCEVHSACARRLCAHPRAPCVPVPVPVPVPVLHLAIVKMNEMNPTQQIAPGWGTHTTTSLAPLTPLATPLLRHARFPTRTPAQPRASARKKRHRTETATAAGWCTSRPPHCSRLARTPPRSWRGSTSCDACCPASA